ncbi:MAG TPA: hypothetical protein VF510_16250 [Ktedonobacterales bacterium]
MGKLVEKLQQVGQAAGGGFGFLRSRGPERAPRPAAVLVSLGAKDVAGAEAAVKNGADGVMVSGWRPGMDLGGIKGVVESNGTVWGVAYDGEGKATGDALRSLQEAGAGFAIIASDAPAGLLFEDLEQFDLGIAAEVPKDDLGLVLQRAENLLPAKVALVQTQLTNADLERLTVSAFARLRLACEALRFPKLIAVDDAPEGGSVRLLVRLGVSGIVLSGAGVSGETLGAQVKALREELEKIPAREEDRDRGSVAIGGLMEASSKSSQMPAPEPEKE